MEEQQEQLAGYGGFPGQSGYSGYSGAWAESESEFEVIAVNEETK